jgi:hypothetical protein
MDRLLILSCSQRKRPDPGLLPAIERYDGPAFRVLRRFLRERDTGVHEVDAHILSAEYGLIPIEQPIANYDRKMTPQRAVELRGDVLDTLTMLVRIGYDALCVAMSAQYWRAFEGWAAVVPLGFQVVILTGSQGVQLAKLKRWLWNDQPPSRESGYRSKTKPRGTASLRGVELHLTPSQVLDYARAALAGGGSSACRLRKWYIELDGQRISPKWLVSVLTKLPVSSFSAGEARRVLRHLGLEALEYTEEVNANQSVQGQR